MFGFLTYFNGSKLMSKVYKVEQSSNTHSSVKLKANQIVDLKIFRLNMFNVFSSIFKNVSL